MVSKQDNKPWLHLTNCSQLKFFSLQIQLDWPVTRGETDSGKPSGGTRRCSWQRKILRCVLWELCSWGNAGHGVIMCKLNTCTHPPFHIFTWNSYILEYDTNQLPIVSLPWSSLTRRGHIGVALWGEKRFHAIEKWAPRGKTKRRSTESN